MMGTFRNTGILCKLYDGIFAANHALQITDEHKKSFS